MIEAGQAPQAFANAGELSEWLEQHHRSSPELWVRIYKVASGIPSVTWADCVVEAIRFGWVDGQRRALDDVSFVQRLTPRKPRSNWSAKNREHAARLEAEGRMTPAGMAHVDAAKADGRWDAAYAGSAAMVIPDDFLQALDARPSAKAAFGGLNRTDLYAIYHRLHTAKRPETRAKRMDAILERLERGERLR